jgi:tRNA (mo5U34)-methyltransferase
MPTNAHPTISEDEIRARIAAVPFWFHQIEVAPGIVTPGIDRSSQGLQMMNLPADLTGKRVLDIGAFDGFYSFECERRGAAEVIAIDGNSQNGLPVIRELLGSQVKFYTMNIYELTPDVFGMFDLVLCLGVLYHLRHPLLGLERVHSVCKDRLILETQVCDHHFIDAGGTPRELAEVAPALLAAPIAQFYPGAELNHDSTNWWSPNLAALHGMLRSVGFEPYQTIPNNQRAYVHCTRAERPVLLEWADTRYLSAPARPQPAAEHGAADAQPVPAQSQQRTQLEQASVELLTQALAAQNQQTIQLQHALAQRDARIADLEARARWLDEQSHAARQALEAVAHGRVMRLLRWLSRAQ